MKNNMSLAVVLAASLTSTTAQADYRKFHSNVDYEETDGFDGCPKGSYLNWESECVWKDYSADEGLAFTDEVLVTIIRHHCKHSRRLISKEMAYFFLQVEREAGFHPRVRGLLAAMACKESGYNASIRGDKQFSKSKKRYMSAGLYQFWAWAKKGIKKTFDNTPYYAASWWKRPSKLKDYRFDPISASIFMANTISGKVERSARECKTRNLWRIWAIANARAARGRNKLRCRDTTSHMKILRRWHKLAKEYETE